MADSVFAAPGADGDSATTADTSELPLASLAQRFAGVVVDGGLAILALLPLAAVFYAGPGKSVSQSELVVTTLSIVSLLVLALLVIQWTLITTRGQSVGKIASGTRIVRVDGSRVGFIDGVLKRNVVLGALVMLLNGFGVGWIITLVDTLMIFGEDHRCLHDYIANTKVVEA